MGISAMYPVIGAIMAQIFLNEKITARAWLGILFCVAGSVVLSYTAPEASVKPYFYLGVGISLLAAFGWGIEGVIATFGMDMVDSSVAITIRQATSCITTSLFILPFVSGLPLLAETFAAPQVLWIIALAGIAGGFSLLFWYRAYSMCGVGRTMSLNVTYVLWGVVFAFWLTDAQITRTLVVGACMITFGAVLVVANPNELLKLRG